MQVFLSLECRPSLNIGKEDRSEGWYRRPEFNGKAEILLSKSNHSPDSTPFFLILLSYIFLYNTVLLNFWTSDKWNLISFVVCLPPSMLYSCIYSFSLLSRTPLYQHTKIYSSILLGRALRWFQVFHYYE